MKELQLLLFLLSIFSVNETRKISSIFKQIGKNIKSNIGDSIRNDLEKIEHHTKNHYNKRFPVYHQMKKHDSNFYQIPSKEPVKMNSIKHRHAEKVQYIEPQQSSQIPYMQPQQSSQFQYMQPQQSSQIPYMQPEQSSQIPYMQPQDLSLLKNKENPLIDTSSAGIYNFLNRIINENKSDNNLEALLELDDIEKNKLLKLNKLHAERMLNSKSTSNSLVSLPTSLMKSVSTDENVFRKTFQQPQSISPQTQQLIQAVSSQFQKSLQLASAQLLNNLESAFSQKFRTIENHRRKINHGRYKFKDHPQHTSKYSSRSVIRRTPRDRKKFRKTKVYYNNNKDENYENEPYGDEPYGDEPYEYVHDEQGNEQENEDKKEDFYNEDRYENDDDENSSEVEHIDQMLKKIDYE